jgi:predicted ATPase/DNA-binding CsgD family transcriptional regulator
MSDAGTGDGGLEWGDVGAATGGTITPFRAATAGPRSAGLPPLTSGTLAVAVRRHNLPLQLTSFIGHEQALAELGNLLATTRLLTLTGPPGVGKTRLAVQLADEALDVFADGVWLVELAPLADSSLVLQAVAEVLGVKEQPRRPLLETVTDALRAQQLLLVFDNCEHLVAATATLADGLLRACRQVKVLATSREALGIMGESTWLVPSLAVPADPRAVSADEMAALRQCEAVQLFVDRARAAVPSFALTERNAGAVAQICLRLDGIPLALELAAARVRALSAEQLAARLDDVVIGRSVASSGDRFRLLTGGSRAALPRQQTLRAAIDWSYALLSEQERQLFRRLSVFAAGWTLGAAEVVCASDGLAGDEVCGLLLDLVDKSLVVADPEGVEARYRLLGTLRQYGTERLREAGEEMTVRNRHLAWCAELTEEAANRLHGGDQGVWLGRLEREHDNLRMALSWSLDESSRDSLDSRERAELGLQLAGALGWFWYLHGYLGEGRRWLGGVLAATQRGPTAPRARALALAGLLAENQGDYRQAEALLRESLAQARQINDEPGVAQTLTLLGLVARNVGEYKEATALLEDGLATARGCGEPWIEMVSLLWLGSVARYQGEIHRATELLDASLAASRALGDEIIRLRILSHRGMVAHAQGQDQRATELLEESLALSRQVGSKWGTAVALTDLGIVASAQGAADRATAYSLDGLMLFRDLGDRWGMARGLHNLGRLAAAAGDFERAARLYVASSLVRKAIGAPPRLSERPDYERDLAAVRARLGEAAFAAASAAGQAMSLEATVDYALAADRPAAKTVASPSAEPVAAGQSTPLTRREREVAVLVAQGLTNRLIAERLVISEMTADSHVSHILRKLGFRSRAQVASWAVEQGLSSPDAG